MNRICPELSDVTRTTSERRETRQTWTLTEVGSEGRESENFSQKKIEENESERDQEYVRVD